MQNYRNVAYKLDDFRYFFDGETKNLNERIRFSLCNLLQK